MSTDRDTFIRLAAGLPLACALLAGCVGQDLKQIAQNETALLAKREPAEGKPEPRPPTEAEKGAEAGDPPTAALVESAAALSERRAKPTIYKGNDTQLNQPPAQEPIRFLGDDVSLNFEQAPLDEIVHAVMGDILQLDYVVDRPIKGQVTLRTRTPIPRDELLVVLESLLKAHDALMIRGRDGRYLITGSQQAMRLRPAIGSADDEAAGYSNMVIPLRYISASAMAEILKPLAEESAFIRVDNTRNLIMLAGTRAQLSGWLDIIGTFDVDMLSGMSVGMFPLENSGVEETVVAIQALLDTAGGTGGDISGVVKVLPMERLNSVLVVSPRAHYLDRVGEWVERLDVNPDARFEKRLHVYPVQNTSATRLAQLLNSIYTGTGGGGAATGGNTGATGTQGLGDRNAVAPGLAPESIGGAGGSAGRSTSSLGSGGIGGATGAGGSSTGIGNTSVTRGSSGSLGAATGSVMTALSVGGDDDAQLANVRVVADEENNALIVYGSGKQFEIITDALRELDVVATQVIIEASIMEVQLTDELRYGVEWTFKNNNVNNRYSGLGRLANTAEGPAVSSTGFSYALSRGTDDIAAVLNALSDESLLNIISTPSVMVLDNNTASISVGDQVPILQGRALAQNGNNNIVENITYRDTGVQLSVRPSVNAGGLITMDIEQSVIDVGDIDGATGQRTFLDRTINSRVAVRSAESVVLGGLIRENASLGDSGVPVLHKIPVIGTLFGSTTTENRRTELLVIITPTALYNEAELRDVSAEMRERVRYMQLLQDPPKTGSKTYK